MSNLATIGYGAFESDWSESLREVPSGRHAFIEDAVLTPIFHALTRGGPRQRRPEPAAVRPVSPADPIETFRRDPLTAPIPVQALDAVPTQPWRRAAADPNTGSSGRRRSGRGRHHRRLEVVGY